MHMVSWMNNTIYWSDRAMTNCAPGLSHWTGWKHAAYDMRLVGQFLWTGSAYFWSGRYETIFYYYSIVVPSIEVLARHPLYGAFEASEFHSKVVSLAAQGFLYQWRSGRRLRPVRMVTWERRPREQE